MIRIAVCDDEKNIRAYLCTLVRKQHMECEITEYASTDEYLTDGTEYDLLFLDISERRENGVLCKNLVNLAYIEGYDKTEVTLMPIQY